MSQALIVQLTSELLWLILIVSLPVVLVTSLLGVLVGLLQGLTQVQDQTLPFLVKMVAATLTLAATYHWMGNILLRYAERSFSLISVMGGS